MMDTPMAGSPAPAGASPMRTLRRDPERAVLGGVCAGIADRLGVDPLVVRVGFIAAAAAGGFGLAVYALAWALVPVDPAAGARRSLPTGRGAVEIAMGAALILLSGLLALRGLGMWFSDAIVWPLVLVAAGAALLWRQSQPHATTPREVVARPEPSAGTPPASVDLPARAAVFSRTGLGIALVIAAGLVFL